jgi:YHS domain-containing protein
MKTYLMLALLLVLGACSHGGKSGGHHGKDHKCNCSKAEKPKPIAYEFDNNCAMGLCRKEAKVPCDPTITAAFNGKHYCFSSEEARATFMKDAEANAKKAHEVWGRANALR